MSQTRKIRKRTHGQKTGKDLQKAMGDVQTALSRVNSLQEIPEVIEGLKEQTKRAALLADAMAEDYETLLQRIVNIEDFIISNRVFPEDTIEKFRQDLAYLTREGIEGDSESEEL